MAPWKFGLAAGNKEELEVGRTRDIGEVDPLRGISVEAERIVGAFQAGGFA